MRIRVFGVDYTVEHKETVESQGDMCYGVHRFGERIIEIGTKRATDDQQAISLVHELLHAILVICGHREHEEAHIEALGSGIVGVLRDNPHLVPILMGEVSLTKAMAEVSIERVEG